jgi:hypothetical protein
LLYQFLIVAVGGAVIVVHCNGKIDVCQNTALIRRIASIAPSASPRSATSLRKPWFDETGALRDSQATLVPSVDWVLGTDDAWKSLSSLRVPRRQRSISPLRVR